MTCQYEVSSMPDLDKKANGVFPGKVVRKDLVRKVKVGTNVPVFVLEYLLGKYCATDDEAAVSVGVRVVNDILANNYVRPDEATKAQSLVRQKGHHTFIDKIKVRYLSEEDKYWAELVNFGNRHVHIPDTFVNKFDRLLLGGIWAQIDLKHEYDEDARGTRSPFWIENITPIQLATFNLEEYRRGRQELTSDNWIDLLIRSIGLEPSHFQRRHSRPN
jgi:ATP-dependent Lon protease